MLDELDSAVAAGFVHDELRDIVRQRYVPIYEYTERECEGGNPDDPDKDDIGQSNATMKLSFTFCGETEEKLEGMQFFYKHQHAGGGADGIWSQRGELNAKMMAWGVGESSPRTYEDIFKWNDTACGVADASRRVTPTPPPATL